MNVHLSSRAFPGLVFLALTTGLFAAEPPASSPNVIRDDRMGICTHFNDGGENWNPERTIPQIAALGVGWIRDGARWGEYEREKGRYEMPAKNRAWIEAAHAAGLKITFILNYGNDLYADRFDPDAYAAAVASIAVEFKGKIQAMEIFNEPNNFGYGKYYGGAWNGLPKDGKPAAYVVAYTKMINRAAVAIKAVNPEMKVIGMGAPAPANHRMIELGIVPQVDGIVDHPYSNHSVPETVPYSGTGGILQRDGIATADANGTFASQIRMYREQSAKFNGPKEIWLTEWGFPTHREHAQKISGFAGRTEDAQAIYTLRRLTECLGLGVNISFVYDFKDDGPNPHDAEHNLGLITHGSNSRYKPAYAAVQRLSRFTASYRVPAAPPAIRVIGGEPRIDKNPLVWDGSPIPIPGNIVTYPFENKATGAASDKMIFIWSAERAGSDLNPRAVGLEIDWPQLKAVKKIRAYDVWLDTWSDVKFEQKDGRIVIANITAPAHPVGLIFSE